MTDPLVATVERKLAAWKAEEAAKKGPPASESPAGPGLEAYRKSRGCLRALVRSERFPLGSGGHG